VLAVSQTDSGFSKPMILELGSSEELPAQNDSHPIKLQMKTYNSEVDSFQPFTGQRLT
jgi:hypothetical protein